jgi:lipoprotein-releasing system permease protein
MARSNRHLGARPVVRIATAGVALGVALMILASAIVQGFQHEVKQLVVGFDSHIQVAPSDPSADGLVWTPGMLDSLRQIPGVAQVALRHERAGILESPQALQGVIVRGIDSTSILDRIEAGLLRGHTPSMTDRGSRNIMLGEPLAQAFDVDTGDKVTLYLVLGTEDIRPRPMRVSGIYQTGLQEFDQRHVWIDAGQMQEAAARGAEAQIVLNEDDTGQPTRAVGQVFGRDPRGLGWRGRWAKSGHGRRFLGLQDLSRKTTHLWIAGAGTLADTAQLWWSEGQWQTSVSEGSHRMVADGYDIWTASLKDIPEIQESLFRTIPYDWSATRVDQQHPEMFSWLRMLDLNVEVIVGLMVLISIVNMTSALLIIMLERRAQVGVWKALGMTDQAVVQTFMWHATRILGQGFVLGNAIALTLIAVQSHWKCVPLDPEAYYVDAVPVLLDAPRIASMELAAFGLCVVAMLLPALWSARIRPSRTLRMS